MTKQRRARNRSILVSRAAGAGLCVALAGVAGDFAQSVRASGGRIDVGRASGAARASNGSCAVEPMGAPVDRSLLRSAFVSYDGRQVAVLGLQGSRKAGGPDNRAAVCDEVLANVEPSETRSS